VLLAALVLAGCLSTPPKSSQDLPVSADPLSKIKNDLPCNAQFNGLQTTANMRRLNLTPFEGKGGPQELDIRGDLLLAARGGGFSTVNISDPLHPRVLGHYGDAGGMLDVKFTPDNKTALVGSYNNIDLVDVRDPENPVQVGRWKFSDAPSPPAGASGQNAHMVFPAHIKGQDWVFLAPQSSTGVWILKLEGTPQARSLKYVTRTLPAQGGLSGPHDIFLQLDALTNKWILYTADAFVGWTAFDVSDPLNPMVIAVEPNTDLSGTHSVQAAKIGERRIVVTSTEAFMNALKVWDATDFKKPILIGYWTRQIGPEMLQDEHNLNILEGRLYMAHYSFGFFVFDLTKLPATPAGALELKPIAHYAGSNRVDSPLGGNGFWDLVLHNGLLYGSAYAGGYEEGLHVVQYGCITPGDPSQTSQG
jgi:hypothetical protein